MEAAIVAAYRGHKVTLLEKDSKLGGNLLTASVPDFKKDRGLGQVSFKSNGETWGECQIWC